MEYIQRLIGETKSYLASIQHGETIAGDSSLLSIDYLHKTFHDYRKREFEAPDRNIYKAIAYLMLELIMDNTPSVVEIKTEIAARQSEPLFHSRAGTVLSSVEFERELQVNPATFPGDERDRLKDYITDEIAPLVEIHWKEVDKLCRKLVGNSYIECYDEFFDHAMSRAYLAEPGLTARIADLVQQEEFPWVGDPREVLDNIVKVAANCNIPFDLNRISIQRTTSRRASMWADPSDDAITLRLPNVDSVSPVLKVWHEAGHAIHVQNMRPDLNFVFKHVYDLRVFEGMAVLWEMIGSRSSGLDYIGQERWWPTAQFLSLYQWLKQANFEHSYQDVFDSTLRRIYGPTYPRFPGAIRFAEFAFKSFRYVSAYALAEELDQLLRQKHTNKWVDNANAGESLKLIMLEGGALNIRHHTRGGFDFD